jgi:acyl-CoA dehydrogenase
MPPTAFVPEVPHARPRFANVRLDAGALLEGDGYARYVKPFRTIEDLHVHAAVLAYLARESRRFGWPHAWTERALATLIGFAAIAPLDPDAARTHLLLAGAMAQGEALVRETEAWWPDAPDRDAAARWQRDRTLLGLASKPRQLRAARAWERAGVARS